MTSGEADETNGLLTGETDNFNDQGHSQDTTKSNAASDQGPVASNVQNVPWLIPPVLIMWPNNPTPFGSGRRVGIAHHRRSRRRCAVSAMVERCKRR